MKFRVNNRSRIEIRGHELLYDGRSIGTGSIFFLPEETNLEQGFHPPAGSETPAVGKKVVLCRARTMAWESAPIQEILEDEEGPEEGS